MTTRDGGIQTRFIRVEMLAREVRVLAMDGFSPRLAEVAARNNLAMQFAELNAEVGAELGRLQDEFHRKVARLVEELQDDQPGSLTG